MTTMPVTDDKDTAIRSMHLMASGDLADFEAVYTADTAVLPPLSRRFAVTQTHWLRGGRRRRR